MNKGLDMKYIVILASMGCMLTACDRPTKPESPKEPPLENPQVTPPAPQERR